MTKTKRYALFTIIVILFILPAVFLLVNDNSKNPAPAEILFYSDTVYAANGENAFTQAALEEIESGVLMTYIPIMIRGDQIVITAPITSKQMASGGYNFQEASEGNVFSQGTNSLGAGIRPYDGSLYYSIGRTYLAWDVPADIPSGYVIERISLVINHCGSGTGMPLVASQIHLGTWAGFLPADGNPLWNAFDINTVVGEYLAAPCPAQMHSIALDPAFFIPGETTRLVMRDSEDHIDLRPLYQDPMAGRQTSTTLLGERYWEMVLLPAINN